MDKFCSSDLGSHTEINPFDFLLDYQQCNLIGLNGQGD